MADHMVKLKEVPKGQKLQFMWDYYRIPAIVTAIVAFVVIAIVKAVFFTPDPDINILLTTQYTFSNENLELFNQKIDSILEDYNNDENKIYQTTPIVYNNKAAKEEPQYAAASLDKFVVELASGLSIIQITDDTFYKKYEVEGCLETYEVFEKFGVEAPSGDKNEIIKVPLSKIRIFSDIKHDEELYLTVRPPMESYLTNEKEREFYIGNLKFISKILSE